MRRGGERRGGGAVCPQPFGPSHCTTGDPLCIARFLGVSALCHGGKIPVISKASHSPQPPTPQAFSVWMSIVSNDAGGNQRAHVACASNQTPITSTLRNTQLSTTRWGRGGEASNELSEGAGGTFGRLPLFITATDQEPLDCNHSKAYNFGKESGKEEQCQSVCENALSLVLVVGGGGHSGFSPTH